MHLKCKWKLWRTDFFCVGISAYYVWITIFCVCSNFFNCAFHPTFYFYSIQFTLNSGQSATYGTNTVNYQNSPLNVTTISLLNRYINQVNITSGWWINNIQLNICSNSGCSNIILFGGTNGGTSTLLNMNYVNYISGYVDTSGFQFNINFIKQITFLGC